MIFHNLKRISLLDLYMNIYIYIYIYIYIHKERQRDSTDKTNRKEVWFDFHMQNLKYSCYEVPNFTFNDREKRIKLQAVLPPLSKNLAANFHLKIIFIELLTG